MTTGSTSKFSSGGGVGTCHSSEFACHGFGPAGSPLFHDVMIAPSRTIMPDMMM